VKRFCFRLTPDTAIELQDDGWFWASDLGYSDGQHQGFIHGPITRGERGEAVFGEWVVRDDQGRPENAPRFYTEVIV
jgi:hypothetical protein